MSAQSAEQAEGGRETTVSRAIGQNGRSRESAAPSVHVTRRGHDPADHAQTAPAEVGTGSPEHAGVRCLSSGACARTGQSRCAHGLSVWLSLIIRAPQHAGRSRGVGDAVRSCPQPWHANETTRRPFSIRFSNESHAR
jgi:hypothetical protein